jgi:lipooligosaccharide transport system permease protein
LTEPPAPVRESGRTGDAEATLAERVHRSGTLPLTPAESAARVRRAGPWYYAEHYLRTMRKYGAVIVVESLGQPLVYLLAMGLGLASLIDGGEQALDGVGYAAFIAPALLASGTLMAASVEFTYPVMDGFTWHRLYYAAQASPLQPCQIAAGHVTAVLLRFVVQSALFLLIMLAFGVVSSPWGWLQVLTATLGGLAIGLPIMAFSASLKRDAGQYALLQRFLIVPLFLFSGTFYPLETLPPVLQWIGWLSPQWHAAQLGRVASYGMDEPVWLTAVHVAYLLVLAAAGWALVRRIFTRRLGWVPGREDPDAVPAGPRGPARLRGLLAGVRTTADAHPRRPGTDGEPAAVAGRPPSGPSGGVTAAAGPGASPGRAVPPMPPIRVRTGSGAGMYGGNVRAVLERGFRALKTSNWAIFASGFFEPVLYLLSLGLGLGGLVGQVEGPGGPVGYGQYIAPALLAVSAMNGAIYDSTWNVFFRMRLSKLYQTMLNTSLGPVDVALGEITMALIRGGLYSVAFLVVMTALGLVASWWAVLLIPAAVLIAFAFAAVGMAVTSYLTTFQQMDWIMLVLMPMFLFSATFFPLSVYPEPVQWLVQALPLWHGVELMRQLSVGEFSPFTAVHLVYFLMMIVLGLLFTSHRLRALFLR